jgi:MFS family permease
LPTQDARNAIAATPDGPAPFLAAPWWAVLTFPFGLTVGFATVAVPFVLRLRGIEMTVVATVSQAAQLPHVIKAFWAPLLDSGPKRRSWFFASIALTAVCLAATALVPPSTTERLGPFRLLWVYTAFLFAAQAAVATSSSAVLALMAQTVPDERRGAASGWQTAGNLAGTAMGGALIAWMINHLPARTTALCLAAICGACALPAAFIRETPPQRRSAARLIAALLAEVWTLLRSREGWTGMLICLSPVGAGGLTNLFSALAGDYAPDGPSAERLVVVVTGVLGGIVNAAGALLGGYVSDRMNRRLAYVLFGGVTALSAVGMMLAPATSGAFTAGCLAYQLANGLCYAAYYAFVLDLVGGRQGVTTQLALFAAAGNLATSYVTWLDGWSYDRTKAWLPDHPWAGRCGMLGMDAAATFAGIAALATMMMILRRKRAVVAPAVP